MADDVRVVLGRHAVDDLRQARDHYAEIDSALSEAFAEAFNAVVERIQVFPHGAPPVDGFPGLRRARMRTFPFGVFYRNTNDTMVLVVRVLHSSRNARSHLR